MMISKNNMMAYLQNKLIAWIQNGPSDDSRLSKSAKRLGRPFWSCNGLKWPNIDLWMIIFPEWTLQGGDLATSHLQPIRTFFNLSWFRLFPNWFQKRPLQYLFTKMFVFGLKRNSLWCFSHYFLKPFLCCLVVCSNSPILFVIPQFPLGREHQPYYCQRPWPKMSWGGMFVHNVDTPMKRGHFLKHFFTLT